MSVLVLGNTGSYVYKFNYEMSVSLTVHVSEYEISICVYLFRLQYDNACISYMYTYVIQFTSDQLIKLNTSFTPL